MNMFRHKLTFWDQLFQIRQRLLRPCTAFWGMHSGRSSSTAPAKTWLSRYWLRMIESTVTEGMINGQSWVMGYNRKIQCISEATSTFRLTLLGSCPAGGSSWNLRWWMAKRPTFELQTCKPLQATVSAFNAYLLSMRVSHDTSPSSFLSFTHSESPPKHLRSFHGSRRDKPHQSSNALSTFEFFHPSPKSEKLDSIFERSESLVFLQVRSLWWTSPSLSEWTLPQQPPQFSRSSWDYMTMLMLMPKYNRT